MAVQMVCVGHMGMAVLHRLMLVPMAVAVWAAGRWTVRVAVMPIVVGAAMHVRVLVGQRGMFVFMLGVVGILGHGPIIGRLMWRTGCMDAVHANSENVGMANGFQPRMGSTT